MNLRQRTGALVVGVRRGGELIQSLDPAMKFAPGDVVFLVGTSEEVQVAIACFETGTSPGHPGDTEETSAPSGELPEEES